MKTLALAGLPVAVLLAACGSSNDIPVTADNQVVLNDAQSNYAFTNDGELGNAGAAEANMSNDGSVSGSIANGASGNMSAGNTM